MKIFQKGFNFSQDGPGNRLVYHIAGCNMHCLWCANPEGMNFDGNHKDYSVSEIIKEAISCKPMFFDGGGVTFTGGEATLDADGLIEVLKGLKDNGINTAIETNGTSERLTEIAQYVDYLIMDFKHFDSDKLKSYTGCDGFVIKDNFEKICKNKIRCHIRIPLINEKWTDEYKITDGFVSDDTVKKFINEFKKYNLKVIKS